MAVEGDGGMEKHELGRGRESRREREGEREEGMDGLMGKEEWEEGDTCRKICCSPPA